MAERTVTVISPSSQPALAAFGSMAYESASDYLSKAGNLIGLASASSARANLGLTIGTQVQAWDPDLDWLSANITAAGKALLDDADASAQRVTLSLGNVENTALSTWVGSSNVTTLGTVATGVWQATTIGLAHGGTNNNLTASNGGIAYSDATKLNILAGTSTAGQVLRSGSSAAPAWSTPTFPNTATENKAIVGDGTNLVLSTPTIPLTSAPGAGKVMIGDGTNWVASTPTYPNASPGAGTFPRGDGTNYVTSTLTLPNALTAGEVLYGTGTNAAGASSGLVYRGTGLTIGVMTDQGNVLQVHQGTNINLHGRAGTADSTAFALVSANDTFSALVPMEIRASTFLLPTLGTTASAANAYIDNAANNSVLRSTSSLDFKRVLGDLSIEESKNLVLNAKAIRYQSRSAHDNPLREFIGFAAEQIAAVDDRFITRRKDSSPDWVQYQSFVVPLCVMVADLDARLARVESVPALRSIH